MLPHIIEVVVPRFVFARTRPQVYSGSNDPILIQYPLDNYFAYASSGVDSSEFPDAAPIAGIGVMDVPLETDFLRRLPSYSQTQPYAASRILVTGFDGRILLDKEEITGVTSVAYRSDCTPHFNISLGLIKTVDGFDRIPDKEIAAVFLAFAHPISLHRFH